MTDTHTHTTPPTDCKQAASSTDDDIVAIKADLRAAMNGVAAKSFRQSGTAYRLVYGVELPRLRSIAAAYEPSRKLAIALWNDNIRETRMLAVMLFPQADFDSDMADLWAESIRRDEADLAGLLVMERVAPATYAPDKAFRWMADQSETLQLCGFLTMTRLLMNGAQLSPAAEAELLDQAASALPSDYLPLKKAVANALMRLADSSPATQHTIEIIISCS